MTISLRATLSIASVLAVAAATALFRPESPRTIEIATGATLLYYNAPAAVIDGGHVRVGYVDHQGVVEVADLDTATGALSRHPIHAYGEPDDHAAPALWPVDGGTLVATSLHSSPLFLYRLDHDGKASLLCTWEGRFSYPRFSTVSGEIRLYVRSEADAAGNLSVIRAPETCAAPEAVATAEPVDWLYATAPDGDRFAWSVYNDASKKHTGAFLDGKSFAMEPSPLAESLAWSVAGDYLSITRFDHAFACCGQGEMQAELYRGGRRIYRSPTMPAPYYPTGIVTAGNGKEALFPVAGRTLARRSLPSLASLPACAPQRGYNVNAQYLTGGDGSYVWLSFDAPYDERAYQGADIYLCLVP